MPSFSIHHGSVFSATTKKKHGIQSQENLLLFLCKPLNTLWKHKDCIASARVEFINISTDIRHTSLKWLCRKIFTEMAQKQERTLKCRIGLKGK